MSLFILLFGLLLALALVGALVAYGGRALMRASQSELPGRETLLALASKAATDRSGRALVALLHALDHTPDSPVEVSWNRHAPASGRQGVLLKITWDGNEWRQIYDPAELRGLVSANLSAETPAGRARTLLSDLDGYTD